MKLFNYLKIKDYLSFNQDKNTRIKEIKARGKKIQFICTAIAIGLGVVAVITIITAEIIGMRQNILQAFMVASGFGILASMMTRLLKEDAIAGKLKNIEIGYDIGSGHIKALEKLWENPELVKEFIQEMVSMGGNSYISNPSAYDDVIECLVDRSEQSRANFVISMSYLINSHFTEIYNANHSKDKFNNFIGDTSAGSNLVNQVNQLNKEETSFEEAQISLVASDADTTKRVFANNVKTEAKGQMQKQKQSHLSAAPKYLYHK